MYSRYSASDNHNSNNHTIYSDYDVNNYINNKEPVKEHTKIKHEKPLEINTEHNVNTSDPSVWGPAFWFTLHNGASKYPIKASPIVIQKTKGFIQGMPQMLPCQACKVHAIAHIESHKISDSLDTICSGRDNLFKFFVDFHNMVNRRHNKPAMSYEEAYKIYNGNVNISNFSYN